MPDASALPTVDIVVRNDRLVAELSFAVSHADYGARVDAISAVVRRAHDHDSAITALIIALAQDPQPAGQIAR